MTTTAIYLLLFPLLVVVGVLLWLSESRQQRARRWRRSGMTQAAIAQRLRVSRTTVRRMLT